MGSGPGIVDRLLEAEGMSRHVAVRVSSFHSAVQCVRETDSVWTGPARVARALDPGRALRHLRPPLRLPTYRTRLVWHERLDADPAHGWLRAQVIASAEPEPSARATTSRSES